jgi:hypothetical protein
MSACVAFTPIGSYLIGGLLLNRWIKISQADKYIAKISVGSIFALLFLGLAMHVMFLLFNYAVTVAAKLSAPDLKATVITASQKTLGTGVAIVAFLPASFGIQGLIILPFIFAHFGQIAMDGFMVPWWLRREGRPSSMWMLSGWTHVSPPPTPSNDGSGDGGEGGSAAPRTPADEGMKGHDVVMLDDVESGVIDDSVIVSGKDSTSVVQPSAGANRGQADSSDRSKRTVLKKASGGRVDSSPVRARVCKSSVHTPLRTPKRTPLVNIVTNARTPPLRLRKHRSSVLPLSFSDENACDTPLSARSVYSSDGDWV